MAQTSTTPTAVTPARRRAAGVYGAIVTAALIAAAGGQLRTVGLAVAVVVTLVVYWIAEEYAELLGAQAEQGKLLSRKHIRAELAATWPMVTASYLPVVVMLVVRLFGASDEVAANVGLGAAILLLVGHAWSAGRAARMRGGQLLVMTCIAAAFGVAMVVMKHVVLVHFH